MPYTNAWNEATPLGTANASDIDLFLRNAKLDIRERLGGIFGLNAAEFAADPIAPKTLTLSGAFAAASGAFSGNLTVGGTAAVTGIATFSAAIRSANAQAIQATAFGGAIKTVALLTAADLLQIGDAGTLTGIDIYAGHATTKAIGITNTNAVTLSSALTVAGDTVLAGLTANKTIFPRLAEPAAVANSFVVYVDDADGKLKAKSYLGGITILANA